MVSIWDILANILALIKGTLVLIILQSTSSMAVSQAVGCNTSILQYLSTTGWICQIPLEYSNADMQYELVRAWITQFKSSSATAMLMLHDPFPQ